MSDIDILLREICQEIWDEEVEDDPTLAERITFEKFVEDVKAEASVALGI